MSTQEETSAASESLAGLLTNMVNQPVIEKIRTAVSDARLQVDNQVKALSKIVRTDLTDVNTKLDVLTQELESVSEQVDSGNRASSARFEEKILPQFDAINTKHDKTARTFHAALEEAFDDARTRDTRLGERIGALDAGLAGLAITLNEHASARTHESAQLLAQIDRLKVQAEAIHGDLERIAGAVQETLARAVNVARTDVARLDGRIGEVKDAAAAMSEQASARIADLTNAISVIGQGQQKLTKLVCGALGVSALAAVAMFIDMLHRWPH